MARTEKLTDEVRAALEAQAKGLPPELVDEHVERAKEWGTWVATQDIPFGNALAYREGDAVPAANVERYQYDVLGWVKETPTPTPTPTATQSGPATTATTQNEVK